MKGLMNPREKDECNCNKCSIDCNGKEKEVTILTITKVNGGIY